MDVENTDMLIGTKQKHVDTASASLPNKRVSPGPSYSPDSQFSEVLRQL